MKRRIAAPIVAAMFAMAMFVGSASANPTTLCNYVFNDSTHTSLTLPDSGGLAQCTAAFPTSSFYNLRMILTMACDSTSQDTDDVYMQFNSDTSTDYAWQTIRIWPTSSSLTGTSDAESTNAIHMMTVPCRRSGDDAHGVSVGEVEIVDVLSSNLDKQVITRWGGALYDRVTPVGVLEVIGQGSGVWRKATPAAITSLTLSTNGTHFQQNSRIQIVEE